MVSATISQGGNLGSGVVVGGMGIVLGHGMNHLDPPPGGRKIISVGAQLAQRVIDFGAVAQEAVEVPRLHLVVEEPIEVSADMDETIIGQLQQVGHRVERSACTGGMAHIAEYSHKEQVVRAGGGGWAAGA